MDKFDAIIEDLIHNRQPNVELNEAGLKNSQSSTGDFGEAPSFGKQGWVCPQCGNVLSPDQSFCIFCYKNTSTTGNTLKITYQK